MGRMLLSHNFNLTDNVFPELSREEFCQVFVEGLSDCENLECRLINNPHWMVEILYPLSQFSAAEVGELCAKALHQKRRIQINSDRQMPDILVLGGIKTSTAINPSPNSLQPGEWGVDVVETAEAEKFLDAIAWENTIASRPADSIFKVAIVGSRE